jgi:hypothetical protein
VGTNDFSGRQGQHPRLSVDLSGAISLLRLLFSDSEEAKRAAGTLKEFAYEPLSAQLLLVSCPDVAGELLKITDMLADHDINVEYGYVALGRTETGEVFLALKVARDKEELARTYLEAEGIQDHDSTGADREPAQARLQARVDTL